VVKPAVGFSRGDLLRHRSGQALHPVMGEDAGLRFG
jgi:hypothetical protein